MEKQETKYKMPFWRWAVILTCSYYTFWFAWRAVDGSAAEEVVILGLCFGLAYAITNWTERRERAAMTSKRETS